MNTARLDYAPKAYNRRAHWEHVISECLSWAVVIGFVLVLAVDKEQVISWVLP